MLCHWCCGPATAPPKRAPSKVLPPKNQVIIHPTTQSTRIHLEAPMSSLAVRLAGITKRYRSNTVLGPIDLDLKPGRVYGLIGENGAGKSTLIRILMGLSKPTSGTIETMDASTPDGLRRSRAQIGYVPIRVRAIRCSVLPTTSRRVALNGAWTSGRFPAFSTWSD